jgi:hypothetical protein
VCSVAEENDTTLGTMPMFKFGNLEEPSYRGQLCSRALHGALRVTIEIILCLLIDDLADVRRPILATKSFNKHFLLFIPP